MSTPPCNGLFTCDCGSTHMKIVWDMSTLKTFVKCGNCEVRMPNVQISIREENHGTP